MTRNNSLTDLNVLNYRSLEVHGLSFELMVDRKPIGEIVGTSDTAVPYWLFKTGVALRPLSQLNSGDTGKRVVAVCPCGTYGCSCISCNVVQSWDRNIVFREFTTDLRSSLLPFNLLIFSFSLDNYNSVVKSIFDDIRVFEAI
ncbi:hypothetical protein [Acaryochloris marina]|uniref:hypothetical protein n=1 Tax=Acaryochloris marina TaxID=155978 RepID=UPI0011D14638|nr:hypothetical protein [Acaryochloris marina]